MNSVKEDHLRRSRNAAAARKTVPALTIVALLLLLMWVAGCATVPDYASMGAAQIKASQEKDGMVTCSVLPTPWGSMKLVTVDVDRGVFSGRYKIEFRPDCSFTAEGEAKP